MGIGSLTPDIGQSCRLRTHDNSRTTQHVRIIIETGILQLSREDLDTMILQEGNTRLRGTGHTRYTEDGSDTGSDEVRIIEVCQRIADDHGVGLCRIGTTEYGTEVTKP